MPQLPTIYPNTPQIPLVVQLYAEMATAASRRHWLRTIMISRHPVYRKASPLASTAGQTATL